VEEGAAVAVALGRGVALSADVGGEVGLDGEQAARRKRRIRRAQRLSI
jgi:hypothetical protein